ncbi:MAG TPA: hypothetical protein VK249_23755 [Anaerolineales bacterium]|nr:hypothetical protein [Anaerolineales bacterium]
MTNGTDQWQLSAVSFQDTLDQNGKAVMPSDESQTFLRVDFECTSGASLVNLYTGSKVQSSGFGVPGGIPDVYVTDSTATRYLAILIENCSVVVPVSKSSQGFKLYFKDLLPIKLGK